jgi:hypothetical protein
MMRTKSRAKHGAPEPAAPAAPSQHLHGGGPSAGGCLRAGPSACGAADCEPLQPAPAAGLPLFPLRSAIPPSLFPVPLPLSTGSISEPRPRSFLHVAT